MSLNAVQTYLQGLINGYQPLFYENPLTAFITPPNPGDASDPVAYVWGSESHEVRQSAPRGAAFKKTTFRPNIWVVVVDDPTRANFDQAFPALVDGIANILRTTVMPVDITDPATQSVYHVVSVGEELSTEYDVLRALEDERYVHCAARIVPMITETFVG